MCHTLVGGLNMDLNAAVWAVIEVLSLVLPFSFKAICVFCGAGTVCVV